MKRKVVGLARKAKFEDLENNFEQALIYYQAAASQFKLIAPSTSLEDSLIDIDVISKRTSELRDTISRRAQRDALDIIATTEVENRKVFSGVYSGSMKQDAMDGHGVLRDRDGNIYSGHFRDNLKHGTGSLTFKDGRILKGDFVNDFASSGLKSQLVLCRMFRLRPLSFLQDYSQTQVGSLKDTFSLVSRTKAFVTGKVHTPGRTEENSRERGEMTK